MQGQKKGSGQAMASTEDSIPRKDKINNGKCGQKGNPGPKGKGKGHCFCKKCAKWAKSIMNMHNMVQCVGFDAEGNGLQKPKGESKKLFEELKRNYDTIKKDNKRLKQKFKREKKRPHKKEKSYDTSFSDSSDSK